MKKIIFALPLLLISHNATADSYKIIPNSAIKGHNKMQLKNTNPTQCSETCTKFSWCKSFDYYKKSKKCDLSDVSYYQIGLKNNYPGNPYDHYIRLNNVLNSDISKYGFIQNQAIKGHNELRLESRNVKSCIIECNARNWCASFDYHKYESTCDLSKESKYTKTLKKNYPGNPYDHYYIK